MAVETRLPQEAARRAHDWHSADYVRDWIAQYESRADSRTPLFDLLADLIPHSSGMARPPARPLAPVARDCRWWITCSGGNKPASTP